MVAVVDMCSSNGSVNSPEALHPETGVESLKKPVTPGQVRFRNKVERPNEHSPKLSIEASQIVPPQNTT
jgi:hypothetical protein